MLLSAAYTASRIASAVPRPTSSEPKIISVAKAKSEIIAVAKAESEIIPVAKAKPEIIAVAKKRPLEFATTTWSVLSGRIRCKQRRYCNGYRRNKESRSHGCPPLWTTAPDDHLTSCQMNRSRRFSIAIIFVASWRYSQQVQHECRRRPDIGGLPSAVPHSQN